MQCLSPLFAAMRVNPLTGKNQVVFGQDVYNSAQNNPNSEWSAVLLPCGRCLACKMRKAREWSVRAVLEAAVHDVNCFVTLTYDDSHLPDNHSLCLRHVQLFLKRLRKSIAPRKVRFLCAGEYGSLNGRPHYHLLLFGYCPDDLCDMSGFGVSKLYFSPSFAKLWPYGFHSIGDLTAKSAAYVARYTVKKAPLVGKVREDGRAPEFLTCSRRPGIGKPWFDKFKDDVYSYDKVILPDGSVVRPPKRFDAWFSSDFPDQFSSIQQKRLAVAKKNGLTTDSVRIKSLTEIMEARASRYRRCLEEKENEA